MSFLVSGVSWLASVALETLLDKATVDLEAIRHARGDINEIRILLKGNVKACHALLRQAMDEGDAISQIQLSQALFGMNWGKDSTKTFALLTAKDLETFDYYPRDFLYLNAACDEALGIDFDVERHEARGKETFSRAASLGYLPARLELLCTEWRSNQKSYGFAVQLRPFVGKGDRKLDYYFGLALMYGCQPGSNLFYEGIYWMNQSGCLEVKCPNEYQTFTDFKSHYFDGNGRYGYQGFLFVTGAVLAPSSEAWEAFVQERLSDVKIAPLDSYLFKYDAGHIKHLLNIYKIDCVTGGNTTEVYTASGEKSQGPYINYLTLYQNHKQIGEISVQEKNSEIYQTLKNPEIQPIIDFIENVMKRTGTALSANLWLTQMGT